MVQYTASDLIREAKIIGKVSNINMTNFSICNSLLNQEYTKLYDKIIMEKKLSLLLTRTLTHNYSLSEAISVTLSVSMESSEKTTTLLNNAKVSHRQLGISTTDTSTQLLMMKRRTKSTPAAATAALGSRADR